MADTSTEQQRKGSSTAEDTEYELLKKKDWRYRVFTPLVLLVLLTGVNLVNYVDRGIIAGAGTSIQGCNNEYTWEHPHTVNDTRCHTPSRTFFCSKDCQLFSNASECVAGENQGTCCTVQTGYGINTTELGFLQSSFMIGYVIAILIFGHLVGRCLPFRLIGIGLTIWCLAILSSGLCGPKYWNTYYGLLVARAFSGVGEASFQVVTTPFIDDYAPRKSKSCWMAVFFTAIPAGTALGYVWAGAISSMLGWEWAFMLEAPIMFPFAVALFFLPHRMKNRQSEDDDNLDTSNETDGHAMKDPLLSENAEKLPPADASQVFADESPTRTNEVDSDHIDTSVSDAGGEHPSLLQELLGVVCSPVCLLVIAGYSQYTAVTAGFAFFAPTYIQEHKGAAWCQFTQLNADLVFGIIIVVSGIIGTTTGGAVLDCFSRKLTGHRRLTEALKHVVIESLLGMATILVCSQMQNPYAFFALLGLGCIFLFCTTAAVNISIMASVPPENRAFAIALSTVAMHLMGDVPSPIVIGFMADKTGPEVTLLSMAIWVVWCPIFWGAAWVVAKVVRRKK